MTTPAQARGIIYGKKYIVVGPTAGNTSILASAATKVGDILTLDEDDDTSLPFFTRLNPDGTVAASRVVIDIKTTNLQEVPAAPAASSVSVRVEQGCTMFIVGRVLTLAERAEVFNLLSSQGA